MTPSQSRTVRVFLSSTFRDFAVERDWLVRKVFPELRRLCRARQVELVDVDLRWGITEEEAQQGRVLPVCLAEIDRSRPWFMGFLGQRYGWVPGPDQYDPSLLQEQPWLEEHRGGKSVTELEILHGVLNNPAMAGRAFFYFRDPAWSRQHDDGAEDPVQQAQLEALKERIRQSGFPVVENYPDPETLAARVREDLWRRIDEAYPESEVPDALTLEQRRHEAYGAPRQRLYLGGEGYFQTLDEALETAQPVLVTGASGGGKSALLVNWVDGWSRRHPRTAIIMHHLGCGADAADPVRLAVRLMQEIGRVTGDEFQPERDPEKQLEQLPEWLMRASAWAELENRDLLLVLDGLDKVLDRRELGWFPTFLPSRVKVVASCLDGDVLAAARDRLAWRELAVQPLTSAEQARFIGEYLGRFRKSLPTEQVRELQRHPLRGNPLFLLTVLEELRVFGVHEELARRLRALLSPPPSKAAGEAPTVDDVFEHVLDRVEGDLGREAVQRAMEALWASRAGLFQDELLAVAGLAPATWAALQNALDEALYESRGRIGFGHDYLRQAVEDRYGLAGEGKRALHLRLAEYFAGLPVDARVAEELPWQWEQAGDREKLKACLTDWELFLALRERDEYELLGYWVRLGGDISAEYEAAWGRWGLDGKELEATAGSLGGFLHTAGCYTAFAVGLREQVLRLFREKLGPEHPATLTAMQSLAISYQDAGRLEKALRLREEVCRLRREKLGSEHSDTLWAMGNLALSYKDAGRLEEALGLEEEVLRLRREKLGSKRLDTLIAMGNLALSYKDVGRLEDALGLEEEVLRLLREKLGPEHPVTVWAMENLAGAHYKGGQLEEALGLQQEVMRLRREKLGPQHPDALRAMGNLALSYRAARRLEEALRLFDEVFRLMRAKLGHEHPYTLRSMHDLAASYDEAGRQDEALGLWKELLRMRRGMLGPEHPDTLSAAVGLALCVEAGRQEEALGLKEEALRLTQEKLGTDHPEAMSSMYDLANTYSDRGLHDKEMGVYAEILRLRREKLGADHPETLSAMRLIATFHWVAERLELATGLFEELLELQRAKLGVDHTDVLATLNSLGGCYSDAGCLEKALEQFRECLELSHAQLGPEHPDTLRAVQGTGSTLNRLGRLPEAVALLRKASAESPGVHAGVRYNLACYECLSGNLEVARRLITEEVAADPEKKEQALKDDDLTAIREFIQAL